VLHVDRFNHGVRSFVKQTLYLGHVVLKKCVFVFDAVLLEFWGANGLRSIVKHPLNFECLVTSVDVTWLLDDQGPAFIHFLFFWVPLILWMQYNNWLDLLVKKEAYLLHYSQSQLTSKPELLHEVFEGVVLAQRVRLKQSPIEQLLGTQHLFLNTVSFEHGE
jgi:hypothetical protein